MEQDYSLCVCDLDGENRRTIVFDRIATYNIDAEEQTCFYQIDDGEKNGLYEMDIDSGESTLLQSGDYNFLHLIGDYLFFESYDGADLYVYDRYSGSIKRVTF